MKILVVEDDRTVGHGPHRAGREAPEHLVTAGVAVAIVHFLEAIEIHQQERGQRLLRARGLQCFFQPLEEQHPVRQIRQNVVLRQM